MVLNAIWSLAFGPQNSLWSRPASSALDCMPTEAETEAVIESTRQRKEALAKAERDILHTTVFIPVPNIRDEMNSRFLLGVISMTLNSVCCYPFFSIRDRHQIFPKQFPETTPRSAIVYLQKVYHAQGIFGIWYGLPCSMICHTVTLVYEAFLRSVMDHFRFRYRKSLPKQLISVSTRCFEFLLYIPLFPLLRTSLLIGIDSHLGPWPAKSGLHHLLFRFFKGYVLGLTGIFYLWGAKSPYVLPIYSTVLPSYILNLLFEIVQTWLFKRLYNWLMPASYESYRKAAKAAAIAAQAAMQANPRLDPTPTTTLAVPAVATPPTNPANSSNELPGPQIPLTPTPTLASRRGRRISDSGSGSTESSFSVTEGDDDNGEGSEESDGSEVSNDSFLLSSQSNAHAMNRPLQDQNQTASSSPSATTPPTTQQHPEEPFYRRIVPPPNTLAVTAAEISATILAAMPPASSTVPGSYTVTPESNRARRGLEYLASATPQNPALSSEFYPEMACAMTSSTLTRILLYPLDTIASRVLAQGGVFPGIGVVPTPYGGFLDCLVRSIKEGGIRSLYSGAMDCIVVEVLVRWVVLEATWHFHVFWQAHQTRKASRQQRLKHQEKQQHR